MAKYKPNPIRKVVCPGCKELLAKFFPLADLSLMEGARLGCIKCNSKSLKERERLLKKIAP